MSHNLSLAQNHAFELARTLMVPITLFRSGDEFGVLPREEIDAANDLDLIHQFDPYDRRPARRAGFLASGGATCEL
ncbi:MAG: hypothetical protein QM636_00490 [Rhizobium sp.]